MRLIVVGIWLKSSSPTVNYEAFRWCYGLREVALPSARSIGIGAFGLFSNYALFLPICDLMTNM